LSAVSLSLQGSVGGLDGCGLMNEKLPEPTENARSVNAILGAMIADLMPMGSSLNELWRQHLERQFKKGQRILVERISRQGISALSDPQLAYFVPASYRFFEQVRQGELEHILAILAGQIASDLGEEDAEPIVVARLSALLSGLSKFELLVFRRTYELLAEQQVGSSSGRDGSVSAYGVTQAIDELSASDRTRVESAQALLSARALLCPISEARLGQNPMSYGKSKYGLDVLSLLKSDTSD